MANTKKSNSRACGSRTGRSRVQTLVFSLALWTRPKAKAWALSHGYTADKVEVTENTLRLRQEFKSREGCEYRMQPFGKGTGIQALLEFRASKANKPWQEMSGEAGHTFAADVDAAIEAGRAGHLPGARIVEMPPAKGRRRWPSERVAAAPRAAHPMRLYEVHSPVRAGRKPLGVVEATTLDGALVAARTRWGEGILCVTAIESMTAEAS